MFVISNNLNINQFMLILFIFIYKDIFKWWKITISVVLLIREESYLKMSIDKKLTKKWYMKSVQTAAKVHWIIRRNLKFKFKFTDTCIRLFVTGTSLLVIVWNLRLQNHSFLNKRMLLFLKHHFKIQKINRLH